MTERKEKSYQSAAFGGQRSEIVECRFKEGKQRTEDSF
jgi:hypothetical protein